MTTCDPTFSDYVPPDEPEPPEIPAPPAGYTALVGILRDGAGDPIEGLLIVDIPFSMKTTEPAVIPPGQFSIFLVAGRPCRDQAGVYPAWLPITATASPTGSYFKLKVRPKGGPEKDLGRVIVPNSPQTNIAAIVNA